MKAAKLKAEQERLAKVKMRKWARRIPDNAMFAKIIRQFPELPFRADFYRNITPYLKFTPVPLEQINENL